ncbi:hypothetical protein AVEN_43050-1 [Araneus ventricosus]|uniref:Reverse transcriptase domain-containing protein n=1 Tax=Araneus ventricosus TaxID=182803 RepID=A0A4Y2T105_ARAVE|nr:hypothetical protein AVEN_43050-1 [Araneus ventricosus]
MSPIKKINPRKAIGLDGASNNALRILKLNAVTHLTKIFNRFDLLHYFHDSRKLDQVLNFTKPGKFPGYYRLISLLTNVGEIKEKLLRRLNDRSNSSNIILNE